MNVRTGYHDIGKAKVTIQINLPIKHSLILENRLTLGLSNTYGE